MISHEIVGIDIGGTRIKAGLVGPGGEVLERAVVEVGDAKSEAEVVDRLAGLVAALGAAEGAPIRVAAAGIIEGGAVIRESPNYPGWRDFALGRRLAERTGRPVSLENDANAVVFGEAVAGAGRGHDSLFGYTLGTGVGGGLVLGGQIWRGLRGMAGELGHVTVVPDGRPCPCGNRGCLEQYAGAVGIRKTMREHGGELAELAQGSDAPARLAALADGGDATASAIFDGVGRALGQAAAALVHTLDVKVVLLCGGIAHGAHLFVPAMRRELVTRTFASMSPDVELRPGALGADAGIVGAATVASRQR